MTTTIALDEIGSAIADVTARIGGLLRGVRDPAAPAIGSWSVGDAAAHLAFVYAGDTAIVSAGDAVRDALPLRGQLTPAAVTDMNAAALAAEGERDPRVLAGRIERSAGELARVLPARAGATVTWLGGIELPVTAVACHLLSEGLVHGFDIARAERRPWPIERAHAVMFIEGAAFPIIAAAPDGALVNQEAAAGLRATIEVRLRGGGRTAFSFEEGRLAIGEPGRVRPDCVVSADPVAFMLIAYGRISLAGAILRGKMLAWGRRPTLAMKLQTLLRTP